MNPKNKYFFVPALAISVALFPGRAQASNQIALPFKTGQTWYVCQGYEGTVSHQNTYSLDLSIGRDFGATACWGEVNRSANQPVLAPANGTISYVGSDLVCLKIDSNRSLLIGHINRSVSNGENVTKNTVLGTLSRAAPVNGGFAHIHLEARKSRNCKPGTSVPFIAAHGFQLAGIGDLPNKATRNDYFKTALSRTNDDTSLSASLPSTGIIVSAATQKALDAGGANGSHIYPHPTPNPENTFHSWRFRQVGDSYLITNVATNKALDAGGANGVEVYPHPTPDPNNPFHLWKIQKVGNAFLLLNKATGRSLDAGGTNGNSVYMHSKPDGQNIFHLWKIH